MDIALSQYHASLENSGETLLKGTAHLWTRHTLFDDESSVQDPALSGSDHASNGWPYSSINRRHGGRWMFTHTARVICRRARRWSRSLELTKAPEVNFLSLHFMQAQR